MRPRSAPAISCTRSSKRSPSSRCACRRASYQAAVVKASEASALAATIRMRGARVISIRLLPARAALHLAPADARARHPLPQSLQPPQRIDLPVAEVLDDRDDGEDEQLAAPPVGVERDLLQQQRAHRQQ